MRFLITCTCALLFLFSRLSAQNEPKKLPAQRTDKPVKIDGLVNEEAWKDAAIMQDLVEFRPNVGRVENPGTRTVTYLMYNDEGIYFGGYCYERTRDSIARELVGRDGFGTNDYVGIIFDTYYDKLNGFEYFVTPLNEQWDAKMSPNTNGNSEDFSWNAVWESGAVIHNDGWSFEMFIPYSAIRFGKKEVQDWGLNITRRRRKTEQQFTWNPINPNVNGFLPQEGIWTGISNIKPPIRLQLSPYISFYANHYPYNQKDVKNVSAQVNGGLDLKYGINQAFTLDMTLIPDFGQVQSDNRILNLSPFDVKFNENRPFFTEGTELFGKGNLFYSRRIGVEPVLMSSHSLATHEMISKFPSESKLINATKVSGRTQKGLGIGFLNAVTNHRYATILDTVTGAKREVLVDPLTNYNIIVLDQTMKNNSSISFINTSVIRSGPAYDANVSAGMFSVNDKTNTWNVSGKTAVSNQLDFFPDGSTRTGYSHNFSFGKTSGRFNFNIGQDLTNSKYTSNDLGYFTFNNNLEHFMWTGYRWIKPTNWYNNLYLNFNVMYSRPLDPGIYRNANINANINGQLKNLWYAGVMVGFEPEYNDFFEAREPGRVFRGWESRFFNLWFETNQSKKYSVFSEFLFVSRSLLKGKRYSLTAGQRYRFNDKFAISHRLNFEPQIKNVGYAARSGTDIIFGSRDRHTVENQLEMKYNFNSRMGLNIRARHYWSKVEYNRYFTLLQDGELGENHQYTGNANQNVNFFNVDMVYVWQFAPGSFLNIVWKDAAFTFTNHVERDYFKNLGNTIESEQNNNISIKLIYFLDYLKLRKKK
ncbi:MAG TPA: DUF5916 domain-containing protein [Flavisolibacter sp.]